MASEIADKLMILIEKIPEESCVIVEGMKDKKALSSLGVKNIITLTKPLFAVVEAVAEKYNSALILTDLDKEGKMLYGTLSSALQKHGVSVDNRLRNFLLKSTKLRQIEGLLSYMEKR